VYGSVVAGRLFAWSRMIEASFAVAGGEILHATKHEFSCF
jgi:hypothetical protein